MGTSGFQLSNASVFREFFLSRSQKRKADGALFCDLVVADLDSSDGLFLTIENKLFTTDRVSQLDDYEKYVNEKFKRAKIREFVYLTLRGTASSNATKDQNWVKLGWLTDISADSGAIRPPIPLKTGPPVPEQTGPGILL